MNITENILSFLRKPASGSAALRQKLAEIVEAIPAAEAEAARLAADRAGLLLTAPDSAIEKIERQEADARRVLDRLCAAHAELQRRLTTAEADEAKARLDSDRADAERLAAEVAEKVRKEYARAAKTIAALVDDLDRAERAVASVNEALAAAGRLDDLLRPVEARAIPEPEHVLPGPYRLAACSLVPAPGFAGLGVARERAEFAGIVASQLG